MASDSFSSEFVDPRCGQVGLVASQTFAQVWEISAKDSLVAPRSFGRMGL